MFSEKKPIIFAPFLGTGKFNTMRLGQAKREFNVETAKIIQFLKQKGIEVSEHPNTKLSDEHVVMLEEAFPKPTPASPEETEATPIPEQKEGEMTTEDVVEETVQDEVAPSPVTDPASEELPDVNTTAEEITAEPQVGDVIEIKSQPAPFKPKKAKEIDGKRIFTALDDEDEEAANAEIIRAPKQELQGLRVVGKVELPEPSEREKKKRIPKSKEETSTKKVPLPEVPEEMAHLHPGKKVKIKAQEVVQEEEPNKKSKGKKRKKKKEKSISERIAEQKKQEEKKKKRKNPHRRLHKSGEQVQRIKVLDDGTIVPRESNKATEEKPKEGLWKRFWRWFNT